MKKIFTAVVFLLMTNTVFAEQINIIVTGSTKGSTNAIAQLIAKDSQSGKFNGIKLNAIAPGNACKGFALVKQQNGNTFVTHYENYYQLVAKMKNDPACPYVSFENANPIVSKVQGLYLVINTNGQGTELDKFSNTKLKIGYSGSSDVEKGWHSQLNKAFGNNHVFVGYNGSSKMRAGIASGEVDAVWTTYSHYLRLTKQKDQYKILLRTLSELDVDAPILEQHFNDKTLTRAFLGTWYVFNDNDNIAKTISQSLEQDFKNNTGEFGTYANNKKLILYFDQETQVNMEKTLSWGQYSSEPNG